MFGNYLLSLQTLILSKKKKKAKHKFGFFVTLQKLTF